MVTERAFERFSVVYRLHGPPAHAERTAAAIALEQTVELPADLVAPESFSAQLIGRVEALSAVDATTTDAVISYAGATVGEELPQLLNVIFGNSSLIPDIRVVGLDLPTSLTDRFPGPRFGRAGIRRLLGVPERPLLCTALKPLGLNARELAELAYRCALGGVDLIKDDHGLADQPSAPFAERVARCAEAVARANAETGEQSIYLANISAPAHLVHARALAARDAGAGGLLIAPGLVGLDLVRQLAADDQVALPIMVHPAFQGSFVVGPTSGIAHGVLFGTLARLAGADATIFPNDGGRFTFTRDDCAAIAAATSAPLGGLAPIFPTPAGGVTLERVPELVERYGHEVILLIGGALLRAGADLPATARAIRAQLGS
jgi:ribulose-bisphosphate carboxylase large chain